jgi:hypothetical protein
MLTEYCWIVMRFSWTCLKLAGEEVASQSLYTLHHGCSV